ncbi:MAG: glycosyltransferase family 4 protein [Saprospiraceae bacterium]|nr:glycosyltransferase family 4 protein [Bacteroidia bacterium]NNL93307.1 glycosyltransferase family 4 protein [Saprospiraceae bacterium]
MKKKHLIILAGPLDNQNAGVHRVTYEIIKGLHDMSECLFDITLIRDRDDGQFPKFKTAKIPLFKKLPGFQSFRLFFIVPLYCILKKADVVFEPAHFGPFNLPKKIKRVTFIHDLTPILFPQFHTFNGAYLQKIFLPRILKKTDLIIANSNNTANDIKKQYPFTKDKVQKIYLGVSDLFKPLNNPEVLEKLKITQPYFLSVSTIEPRKNIETLLEAFRLYKEEKLGPEKLVLVGGKGWKNNAIYSKINDHPNVNEIILPGFVTNEELIQCYSQCNAFIYPSIYEGFGLPLIEAAVCGAPLVVANNSSLKEITPFKELLFETLNAEDLKEKMSLSKQVKPNQEFIDSIRSKYNWKKFVTEFTDSISSLFKQN